jgi:hypothetical protein
MTTITQLTGTATFTSWDEEPGWDSGAPTPRLAHAMVTFVFSGDIEGTSSSQSVMHYADDASGVTVGIERLDGHVDGRPAGLVLRHEGTFDADGVVVRWSVVSGSGTGALAGFAGGGGFTATAHSKEWTWRLDRDG